MKTKILALVVCLAMMLCACSFSPSESVNTVEVNGGKSFASALENKADFEFKIEKDGLYSIFCGGKNLDEDGCTFSIISKADGSVVVENVMIHRTEWLSRNLFLKSGEYALDLTCADDVTQAECEIKTAKGYENAKWLTADAIGDEAMSLPLNVASFGEEISFKIQLDGSMEKIHAEFDGINTYYDSCDAFQVKMLDSQGKTVYDEYVDYGGCMIDAREFSGEYTLVLTPDSSNSTASIAFVEKA